MGQIFQETHHPGGRMTKEKCPRAHHLETNLHFSPFMGVIFYVRRSPNGTFEVETTTNVYRGLNRWVNFECLKLKYRYSK
jgi:hypothetical protein